PVKPGHVEAELVAAKTALVPGESLTVALRLKMERDWHTYWRNPGDSGLPTTLTWTLPPGVTAGPIEWPTPKPLAAGPLVNYGYDDEVLLLTEIKTAAGTPDAAQPIKARADWLVCREVCIPEGADLTLSLPIAPTATPDPRWAAPLDAASKALPQPLTGWQVTAQGKGSTVELKLMKTDGAAVDPGALRFFPYTEAQIEPSAPQTKRR